MPPSAADEEDGPTRSEGCCVSTGALAGTAADSLATPDAAAPGTNGRLRLPLHVPGSSSIASITVLKCFVVGTSDHDLDPLLYLFACRFATYNYKEFTYK